MNYNLENNIMARRNSAIRDIRANALDKQSESTKMAKVYTTAKINQILEDIKKGKKPDLDPFYHGKKDLRDTGVTFERTEEEEEEYRKCAMDCIYFASNYVRFKNDKGFTLVKLRDYQKDVLKMFSEEIWDDELLDVRMANRRVILMQSRQTAKCFDFNTCLQFNEKTIEEFNFPLINDIKYNIMKYLYKKLKKFVKNVIKKTYLIFDKL